jgi:hypothetical protein
MKELNETRLFDAMKQLRELEHEMSTGDVSVSSTEHQAIAAVGPILRALWEREVERNNDQPLVKARRAYQRQQHVSVVATKSNQKGKP